jgi:hypothetical protein
MGQSEGTGTTMHGLINRAIQSFVCLTYGRDRWEKVMQCADLGFEEFEAMLIYDDQCSERVLRCLCRELDRDLSEILEDLGTFLVSHPDLDPLRRLLRFGGGGYLEFLHSLDDLPDRTRLAVSDLHLPKLELREFATGHFNLSCASELPGFGHVMMGVLRAMADDYGALAFLEMQKSADQKEVIRIALLDSAFAEGRGFDLGARAE